MPDKTFWARDAILVVDDDILQRELFKNCLEDVGLELLEAEDGEEALEVFRREHPMLVVMDVNMPRKNGLDTCREMKEIAGQYGTAVILVTGQDDSQMVQEAYQVGANEYLTKPVDWDMLLMRVKFALRIQGQYLDVRRRLNGLSWAQSVSGMGSWEIDPKDETLTVSDEVLSILDLGPERHSFGLNELSRIVAVEGRPDAHDGLTEFMKTGRQMDIDYQIRTVKGRRLAIHFYGEPSVEGDGRRPGYYGFIQDITERKRAEERIREAAAAKEQFMTNISHELRTPLNGVLGMADLLNATGLDENQNELVGLLQNSARKLLDIVGTLLDYSALTTDRLVLRSLEFPLEEVSALVQEEGARLASRKGLDFQVHMQEGLPGRVVGDSHRIAQILNAMVDNAVKFTEQGHVQVEISRFDTGPQKDWVRFSVRDTGIGIPEDKRVGIFEHFSQADGSMTRAFGGLGMGLTLCRELVSLMEGRIGMQCLPEGGTEFWFVLPFERIMDEVEPAATGDGDDAPFGNRILVVEDDPINQLYIRKCLLKLGYEVELAGNGSEALEKIRKARFRLVLMDCQMPVMDGYEATGHIRDLGGHYAEMPIIALTAHAGPEDRQKCLDAGMDMHMTKPFTGQELMQVLGSWLGPIPLG